MKIGIDVSQLAYSNTGVANYLSGLVSSMINNDNKNEYVLFFSSMRRSFDIESLNLNSNSKVIIKNFRIPPSALNFLWNTLHVMPIENFIGNIDVFITSDWAEPPTKKAKKATIIYDLIVFKYPEETHSKTEFDFKNLKLSTNIVDIQKKKLSWVKKESDIIFCISNSSKNDAIKFLGIEGKKIKVIYPGLI